MPNGALDGVGVIDFGQYIAGPLAAVMLADQGADVIHVDPPGGPRWRIDADAFYNRGKNFRPGVIDRFGLGSRANVADATAHRGASTTGWV